ncbi:putative nucleic acid binding protein 12 [Elsinoe australis]|uniref:Putative nucleic acid binding protein 12 n=1 Tax=Elsinoe australis TaxID=40998 RepID=A0A4U7B533_9PEZI|nr:putative nucleic acid binding protein 12 [Elsinoe australis]
MQWPRSFFPDGSWRVLQRHLGLTSRSGKTRAADSTLPAPFSMKDDVVFVSIDIEAWEMNHSQITELGIAVLDTRDIHGIAPGPGGSNWIDTIQSRHFIDSNLTHLVNSVYVEGRPDEFNHGDSEYVPKSAIVRALRSVLHHGFDYDGSMQRNVVMVVHDKASEQRLVQHLDKKAFCNARVLFTADTQVYATRDDRRFGLEAIAKAFSVEHECPHNAGNDAVVTLQALVKMVCLRTFESKAFFQRSARLR